MVCGREGDAGGSGLGWRDHGRTKEFGSPGGLAGSALSRGSADGGSGRRAGAGGVPGAGGGPAEARAAAEEGAERRGDGAVRAGAGGGRRHGPRCVHKILLDLLKLNVAPLAVFQMLKSMCAGQRLPSESQAPAAVSLPTSSAPETRATAPAGHLSGSHGAPDSSSEYPPQRLPHAASELSELAALLRLAADWTCGVFCLRHLAQQGEPAGAAGVDCHTWQPRGDSAGPAAPRPGPCP
ncbi:mitotic-spindle organizing protein 2A-like [Equus quagga]|uniref:mitotic-spindle organizing protein 2A-like n=1 Tax=Equus quagga TaxID=89248 RepID=UPI001EE2C304|nr:mitotic-spindle organizing protein 2A-like [Equus quagga]